MPLAFLRTGDGHLTLCSVGRVQAKCSDWELSPAGPSAVGFEQPDWLRFAGGLLR